LAIVNSGLHSWYIFEITEYSKRLRLEKTFVPSYWVCLSDNISSNTVQASWSTSSSTMQMIALSCIWTSVSFWYVEFPYDVQLFDTPLETGLNCSESLGDWARIFAASQQNDRCIAHLRKMFVFTMLLICFLKKYI